MKKTPFIKIVCAVVICIFLDIGLHIMTSAYSSMPDAPNYSYIAILLGTELSAILWAILSFSSSAIVFWKNQSVLYGVGFKKGLRYGFSVGILWLLGMMEGVSIFGNPILNEFVIGLSDAIPIFLMSILISGLMDKNEKSTYDPYRNNYIETLRIVTIAIIFLLGRYIAYFSGIIQTGIQSRPLLTFCWTVLMGANIGFISVIVNPFHENIPLKQKTICFAFGIFGVNWSAFLLFMPILFSNYLTDVLFRICIDIFLVTVGYYLAFRMKPRSIKQEQPMYLNLKKKKGSTH
jgi:hypothetical protein